MDGRWLFITEFPGKNACNLMLLENWLPDRAPSLADTIGWEKLVAFEPRASLSVDLLAVKASPL